MVPVRLRREHGEYAAIQPGLLHPLTPAIALVKRRWAPCP